MDSSFLLLRPPPRLPPLTTAIHRPLLSVFSSSSSPLHPPSLPEAIASSSSFKATVLPFASHILAGHTRDPRRSWKTRFSGLPLPPPPQATSSDAEDLPQSCPPVTTPPALPFHGGDLLRGAWGGFWLQLSMAVLSRLLIWANERPYAHGFPRPAVAAWVLLGLWRSVSPDFNKKGPIPFRDLVAGVTGKQDLGPVTFSAVSLALLLIILGSFLSMDRVAAWAVSLAARRTMDVANIAFCVWSVWAISGAGKVRDGEEGGHRAPRWWELAMLVVGVHACVLCLCLPHNLVKLWLLSLPGQRLQTSLLVVPVERLLGYVIELLLF